MKKPKPPADLWEQMDNIVTANNMHRLPTDDPGVSIKEFAERYRITYTNATKRLQKLTAEGKLIQGWRKSPTTMRTVRVYRPA